MPKKLEDYIPVVMEAGVVTNKAASFGGATTFASTTVASATATTAGGAVGIRMGSAATELTRQRPLAEPLHLPQLRSLLPQRLLLVEL